MKRVFSLAALGLALALSSCKDGPAAGELAVELATPNADDGAIMFTATASAASEATITGATAGCSGCKIFVVKVNDTQYKGVLTGTIAAGTIFRVGVSDTKKPANYSVVINAVSNRTFVLRSSLTGYSVTLK
jgi:hypothetical protein